VATQARAHPNCLRALLWLWFQPVYACSDLVLAIGSPLQLELQFCLNTAGSATTSLVSALLSMVLQLPAASASGGRDRAMGTIQPIVAPNSEFAGAE
jgi:hypothetical protein